MCLIHHTFVFVLKKYDKNLNNRKKHLSSHFTTYFHVSQHVTAQQPRTHKPAVGLLSGPFSHSQLTSSLVALRVLGQCWLCSNGLWLHGRTPAWGTIAVCNDAPCSTLSRSSTTCDKAMLATIAGLWFTWIVAVFLSIPPNCLWVPSATSVITCE